MAASGRQHCWGQKTKSDSVRSSRLTSLSVIDASSLVNTTSSPCCAIWLVASAKLSKPVKWLRLIVSTPTSKSVTVTWSSENEKAVGNTNSSCPAPPVRMSLPPAPSRISLPSLCELARRHLLSCVLPILFGKGMIGVALKRVREIRYRLVIFALLHIKKTAIVIGISIILIVPDCGRVIL